MSVFFIVKSSTVAIPPPIVVQSGATASGSSGGATTISKAYTLSVQAGNCLIALVGWYSGGAVTVTSVKDNLNNLNWKLAGTFQSANNAAAGIYYYPNTFGGACTVTLTVSASAPYLTIFLFEVQNLSGVVDASSGNSWATITNPNPGALVTTAANDFLAALCSAGSGNVTGGASGWTYATWDSGGGAQDIIEPTPGTYIPSFVGSSGGYSAVAAAFLAGVNASAHQKIIESSKVALSTFSISSFNYA